MPQIKPISDLRNTQEISDICHTKKEPLFITKNGYGDLVVMSIEMYEDLMAFSQIHHTDMVIQKAEDEYATEKNLFDARDTLAGLKRRYFG